MPASASASNSSPPRPKINGSPPLRRITVSPRRARSIIIGADFFLRKSVDGFLFSHVNALAMFGREIQQMFVGEMVEEHGIGQRQ